MDHPLRRPEEILAYRSLRQILAAKPKALWTIGPRDNALTAMRLMAEKNVGLLVVIEHGAIVGVLSERDCVRRLVLAGRSSDATPVADIMVRDVIKMVSAEKRSRPLYPGLQPPATRSTRPMRTTSTKRPSISAPSH